jgi:hypothetical protein
MISSGKLIAAQQDAEARIAQVQQESHQRLTDYALRSALGSRRYANTRLTPQQNADDARALLDAHLRLPRVLHSPSIMIVIPFAS